MQTTKPPVVKDAHYYATRPELPAYRNRVWIPATQKPMPSKRK